MLLLHFVEHFLEDYQTDPVNTLPSQEFGFQTETLQMRNIVDILWKNRPVDSHFLVLGCNVPMKQQSYRALQSTVMQSETIHETKPMHQPSSLFGYHMNRHRLPVCLYQLFHTFRKILVALVVDQQYYQILQQGA